MSDTQATPSDDGTDRTDRTDRRDRADRTDDGYDTLDTDMMQWVSALAALVGLWVVASPFIYEATDAAYWNNTLVGTGIFLLAGYNFVRMSRDRLALVGVAALVILLGLWVAASPFVIEMGSNDLELSTIASGLVIAALAAYNAYANNKADTPERARART